MGDNPVLVRLTNEADDPGTSPDRLADLARYPLTRGRVAQNPNIGIETFISLARRGDCSAQLRLNPSLPLFLLEDGHLLHLLWRLGVVVDVSRKLKTMWQIEDQVERIASHKRNCKKCKNKTVLSIYEYFCSNIIDI